MFSKGKKNQTINGHNKTNGNLLLWNIANYYTIGEKTISFWKYNIDKDLWSNIWYLVKLLEQKENIEIREIIKVPLLTSYIKSQRL